MTPTGPADIREAPATEPAAITPHPRAAARDLSGTDRGAVTSEVTVASEGTPPANQQSPVDQPAPPNQPTPGDQAAEITQASPADETARSQAPASDGIVRSAGDAVFTTEARAARSQHEATASSEAIAVERIDDAAQVAEMLRSLADGTRRQLLSALPRGEYSVELLRSSWDVDMAMLARGVDIRVVYPAETARKPAFLQYLSDFANAGAAVRISAKVPHRIVVSDRRTAVVPVHPEEPGRAALVMREPVVVASVCAQFTTLWRTAWPVGVSVKNGLDVDLIRDTLNALAKWPTDETAARHLGTSVRTLRRRIAAIMELLGASSRFEAGLKAQEGGWI